MTCKVVVNHFHCATTRRSTSLITLPIMSMDVALSTCMDDMMALITSSSHRRSMQTLTVEARPQKRNILRLTCLNVCDYAIGQKKQHASSAVAAERNVRCVSLDRPIVVERPDVPQVVSDFYLFL